MKKIFGTALLLLILTVGSNAQFIRSYGIKVGTVSSNLDFNYIYGGVVPQNDPKWGFAADGFIEFLNIPLFSIVTSLDYLQIGTKQNYFAAADPASSFMGTFQDENTIDYLGLSLLAKLRFSFPVITPYIIAGPQFNLETGRSVGASFDAFSDDYKKNNWTLALGAGAELNFLLPMTFLAEVKYNMPITSSYKSDYIEVKNNSFEIKAGVAF